MSEIRWVSETIRARIASDANMQAALRYLDEADPNYNLGVLTAIGLKSVGIDYIGACHAYEVMLSELDSAKKAAPIDEESIFSEFGVHKDTQHLAMAYEKCEAARKRKDEAWKPLGELREAATYPSLIA